MKTKTANTAAAVKAALESLATVIVAARLESAKWAAAAEVGK